MNNIFRLIFGIVVGVSSFFLIEASALSATKKPSMNANVTTYKVDQGSQKVLNWRQESSWYFKTEQNQPVISLRYLLEFPKNIKVVNAVIERGSQGKIVLDKEKSKLQGLLLNNETNITLALANKTEIKIVVKVDPLERPLIADPSCKDLGVVFEKMKPSGNSNYFAGAICSLEKNLVRLVISTAKNADWQGSSLFEHDGKGERWKLFKIDMDAASSGQGNSLGNLLWGPQDATVEYKIVVAPRGGVNGIRDLLRAEVSVAIGTYSLERVGQKKVALTGVFVPVSAFLSPWRTPLTFLARWVGLIYCTQQDSQNTLAEWSVGGSYEFGSKTLIVPSLEYQSTSYGSKDLALSTSFQGPSLKVNVVTPLINAGTTLFGAGYSFGNDGGATGSLIEVSAKQNLTVKKAIVSAGFRYQQLQLTAFSNKFNGSLLLLEVGTQF